MSECTIMSKSQASYETRLRAVQAVLTGMSRGEVAQAYGIDRTTLCRWIIRFRNAGAKGLSRKPGSGRPPRGGCCEQEQAHPGCEQGLLGCDQERLGCEQGHLGCEQG